MTHVRWPKLKLAETEHVPFPIPQFQYVSWIQWIYFKVVSNMCDRMGQLSVEMTYVTRSIFWSSELNKGQIHRSSLDFVLRKLNYYVGSLYPAFIPAIFTHNLWKDKPRQLLTLGLPFFVK